VGVFVNKKDLYKQATETWGEEAQIKVVLEELAELSLAILHYYRGKCSLQDMASEVADVEIMLEQLRVLFPKLDEYTKVLKDYKLARLDERLNGSKDE
jgi:hypothetical protein